MNRAEARVLAGALVVVGTLAAGLVFACSDRIYPASTQLPTVATPPEPAPDAADDADIDTTDAYAAGKVDLGACSGCVCAAATSYCFGGGSPRKDPLVRDSGADGDADAGPPMCPVTDASATENGCNALPAKCANDKTCACILDALQPGFACYLVCADTSGGPLVYCPHP